MLCRFILNTTFVSEALNISSVTNHDSWLLDDCERGIWHAGSSHAGRWKARTTAGRPGYHEMRRCVAPSLVGRAVWRYGVVARWPDAKQVFLLILLVFWAHKVRSARWCSSLSWTTPQAGKRRMRRSRKVNCGEGALRGSTSRFAVQRICGRTRCALRPAHPHRTQCMHRTACLGPLEVLSTVLST